MRRLVLLAALVATSAPAREATPPPGLKLDRVVLLMRHGVRPPTKAPPMPAGVADRTWPSWTTPPGYLTPHGATAVGLVANDDRARWAAAGLLKTSCPRVRIVADSDQRTIETARAYAASLVLGCTPAIEHKPQDTPDPLFSPVDEGAAPLDADAARAAVLDATGPGGIAGVEARARPLLVELDAILCAAPAPTCGVAREPSGLAPPKPNQRPKLTGALDRASTAAQILLLEYADGKPAGEIGWGKATPAAIARLSAFHAIEFRLLARPTLIARANLALLAPLIADSLAAPGAAPVTMISGHDTNVASLGGLLGIHWRVPGFAADDPSPGGAIMLERLVDPAGRHYVRALYRSQTLSQIRALTPPKASPPYLAILPIPGCKARGVTGLCEERAFLARLGGAPQP